MRIAGNRVFFIKPMAFASRTLIVCICSNRIVKVLHVGLGSWLKDIRHVDIFSNPLYIERNSSQNLIFHPFVSIVSQIFLPKICKICQEKTNSWGHLVRYRFCSLVLH